MVFEEIAALLSGILQRDENDFTPHFELNEKNGVSALDIAKLAIAMEKHFALELYDEKIALFKTLSDAATHIEKLLEEGLGKPPLAKEADRNAWFYE
jgi:Acyl carrier protein